MENLINEVSKYLVERKRYVSYKVILLADVYLSLAGSLVSLFFIDSFIAALSWSAYATVLFAGGVTTFLVFWLSGTSKNIIRHASMKSMGRLCFAILLSDILLGGVLFWSDWCLFGHHLFAFCLLCIPLCFFQLIESDIVEDLNYLAAEPVQR